MTDETPSPQENAPAKPRWRPLGAIDRRVVGVLAEKAKTTPDAYPMSLNAVCSGCNQKSNRAPLMSLEPDDVEQALDRLREWGAVGIIQGLGRVSKYRHYLYEWLGVDKMEMAVMVELLLRGAQTEGDLRARASRMEPIAGLNDLRPILVSLQSKGLVIALTPEGRGHVVTHALYQPNELERLRAQYQGGGEQADGNAPSPARPTTAAAPVATPPAMVSNGLQELLNRELEAIRSELAQLRDEVESLSNRLSQTDMELGRLKDALGG
jgi:uncharacterized protein